MSDTKLTILLASALFLISAPEPDSATIAEMSAHFIVPANERALLAAERDGDATLSHDLAAAPPDASAKPVSAKDGARSDDGSVGPG